MDPFRHYLQAISGKRHCPLGSCAACRSQPALVRMQFTDLVRQCWSPEEIDILNKAARAALL
jgi:hypothetical protein